MAKLDRAREELGWLKVLFAAYAAADASLIAWAARAYAIEQPYLVAIAVICIAVLSVALFRANRLAYRRIHELETL